MKEREVPHRRQSAITESAARDRHSVPDSITSAPSTSSPMELVVLARLTDVPREVRSEIYQTAALEKENADLRERLAAAERELVRYRAMGVVAVGRERELGSPEFRDLFSGLAAAAQGGGSV